MVNINALKVFSDLVNYASFSKAARKNKVSQSAVSQQIKTIEKNFNVHLIEKNQKSLQLTREGAIFYKYAQKILSSYTSMLEDINDKDIVLPDELCITTSYWIGVYILPELIQKYFKQFHKFHVDINYREHPEVNRSFTNLRSSLFFFESPVINHDFVSKVFTQEQFVPVGAKTAFPKPTELTIDQINKSLLIGFSRQHPLRKIFEKTISEIPFLHIRYKVELNQIELIKQAILSGQEIAFLPKSIVSSPYHQLQFQILKLPKKCLLKFPIYVSYPEQSPFMPSIEQFLSLIDLVERDRHQ